MGLVTVDPTVQVAWGDWVHLPANTGPHIYTPERFVCLSPGAPLVDVWYHADPALVNAYNAKGKKVFAVEGDQAAAFRRALLGRCSVEPEDAARPTG